MQVVDLHIYQTVFMTISESCQLLKFLRCKLLIKSSYKVDGLCASSIVQARYDDLTRMIQTMDMNSVSSKILKSKSKCYIPKGSLVTISSAHLKS